MAIRTILKMGDPRLLEPASPVDIELITSAPVQEVIDDLLQTMQAANGAGLAAPLRFVDLRSWVFCYL